MKKTIRLLTLLCVAAAAGAILWARPAIAAASPAAAAAQGTQTAKKPQWKSRAEYDAFMAFVNEKDATKRVPLIEAFLEKYPSSDFKGNALVALMQTYQQMNDTSKALDAAKKALAADPDNSQVALPALNYLSFAFPYTYKSSDANASSELSEAKQHAQAGLQLLQGLQKPANVTEAKFEAFVKPMRANFNLALGFAALQQKDYASAIAPLKSAIQDESGSPQEAYYLLGQAYLYSKPPDYNNAIWNLARAVALAKKGNSNNGAQMEKFFSQVYENQRGSNCGESDVLSEAASSAEPPSGFNVAAPPTHPLTGNKAWDSFYQNIEDPLLVGCDAAQKAWTQLKGQPLALVGTVVGVQPGSDPGTTLVNVANPTQSNNQGSYDIQLQDSSQPDAKLLQAGDPVSFQGALSAYTTSPSFYVTLSDAKINGDVLKMASERAKAKAQEEKEKHKPHGKARR